MDALKEQKNLILDENAKCPNCTRKNKDHKYRVTIFEHIDEKKVSVADISVDRWDTLEGFLYVTDDGITVARNLKNILKFVVSERGAN